MNVRNTTPKESMLNNIRQALLHKAESPGFDSENLTIHVDQDQPTDVLFARNLTDAGGVFVYCDGEIDLMDSLIHAVYELKVTKLAILEPGLRAFLQQYGFPVYDHPSGEDIQLVMTSCESLVARHGSILISSGTGSGRSLSVSGPIHFVIAKASQIVLDINDGLQTIKSRYGEHIPSMLSLLTGPSKTNIFNNTFQIGGVGSQHLFVFLLEDRY